jgi:membrane-associated phospholipid phosphatase
MKSFWTENKVFLIPCLLLWLTLLIVVISIPKSELHLFINRHNFSFGDSFFQYYTHIGGFLFIAAIIVGLLFYKYQASLFVCLSELLAVLIVFPLKILFAVDRPLLHFADVPLHLVDTVILENSLSFPSGHSACAFALFMSLAVLVKLKGIKFLFFILAVLVAYSRVYLSHHFVEDVFAGSVIGVLSVFFVYLLFYTKSRDNAMLSNSLRTVMFK